MAGEFTFKLKLQTSQKDIQRHIIEAVAEEFDGIFRSIAGDVRVLVRNYVHSFFQFSETYQSLTSGLLVGHFGFPRGSESTRANAVINAVADSTEVIFNRVQPQGSKITGGLTILVGSTEYDRYLSLPEASVTYTNKDGKSVTLPWLEWLLKRGDKIIISDYKIRFGPSKNSRSGLAIMLEDPTSDNRLNYIWRVPPEFSGTTDHNWITETLKTKQEGLWQAVTNDLQRLIESKF